MFQLSKTCQSDYKKVLTANGSPVFPLPTRDVNQKQKKLQTKVLKRTGHRETTKIVKNFSKGVTLTTPLSRQKYSSLLGRKRKKSQFYNR